MTKPIPYHLQEIPEIPKVYRNKKKKPKEIAIVESENCTGCEACVPFCPVDCIEHWPDGTFHDQIIQPVRVRLNECIGCKICVKVCEKVAWNAIFMHDTAEVEETYGIKVTDKFVAENPVHDSE